MIKIACLSQKGGVGKSTLARLIATTYAHGGWRVRIADFNVKQKTCVDWAELRARQGALPAIDAVALNDIRTVHDDDLDLIVFDGKPDSDTQTIRIAQEADMVVIPTGVSADDLVPQMRFAQELKLRGIPSSKIFCVINKATDSFAAIEDARNFIEAAGFEVALIVLFMKTAYVNAHNGGLCVSETAFMSLNKQAVGLAQEIINHVNKTALVPA